MENPFLKLEKALRQYRELCLPGNDACLMAYKFYDWGCVSHLLITRKENFSCKESALVFLINKFQQLDNDYGYLPVTDEDYLWEAYHCLIQEFAWQKITEIPSEKFINQYDDIIDVMTGCNSIEENGKFRYVYNNNGIYLNGQEYSGCYQLLDPLRGQRIEKCYAIFDEWGKKIQYMGISDRYYIYLTWAFGTFD